MIILSSYTALSTYIPNGTPPEAVLVLGRDSIGDAGAGTFVYVQNETVADDGIYLSDNAGNIYKRVFGTRVDARWYGFKESPTVIVDDKKRGVDTGIDNSPALNAACAGAVRAGVAYVDLAPGYYHFSAEIDASGVRIVGAGSTKTWTLFRDNGINAYKFRSTRNGEFVQQGDCSDLAIVTLGHNELPIFYPDDAAFAQENPVIRNVRITNTEPENGTWKNGVFATGQARLNPDGLRKFTLEHVEVFATRDWAYSFYHVQGIEMINCNSFSTDGSLWSMTDSSRTGNTIQAVRSLWFGGTASRPVFNASMVSCKMVGHVRGRHIKQTTMMGNQLEGGLDMVGHTMVPVNAI